MANDPDSPEKPGGSERNLPVPSEAVVLTEPASGPASSPLPTIHLEHDSAIARRNIEHFVGGIAAMFEAWVARRENPNTQRAYRADVLSFAQFVGIPMLHALDESGKKLPPTFDPSQAHRMVRCGVGDVQEWRDYMVQVQDRAPKTVLRRITSLSRFYEYIREQAAEFRIATTIPNPAHKNHIPRFEAESVRPTDALTPARIRQLKEMAPGESPIAYRDRAIIRLYLYTGARIRTGCLLRVEDCRLDAEDSKLMLQEKGHGSARSRRWNPLRAHRGPAGVHHEGRTHERPAVPGAEEFAGRGSFVDGHQRDHHVPTPSRLPEAATEVDAGGRARRRVQVRALQVHPPLASRDHGDSAG